MFDLHPDVTIWLIVWSFIGSSLGFLTIRNEPHWTRSQRLKEYFKSVAVGIFFAFPTCMVLSEKEYFTTYTSLIVSGSVAFIVTDCILKIWPKLISNIDTILNKLVDKIVGKL